MRLWHESLLSHLDDKRILSQHRECCALRGKGWGRKHETVDYVFTYPMEYLVVYHMRVMIEMTRRGFKFDSKWLDITYRGKRCEPNKKIDADFLMSISASYDIVYNEHNDDYLKKCIDNLKRKGFNFDSKVEGNL